MGFYFIDANYKGLLGAELSIDNPGPREHGPARLQFYSTMILIIQRPTYINRGNINTFSHAHHRCDKRVIR